MKVFFQEGQTFDDVFVVAQGVVRAVERHFLPQPVRDVAQVAQGAGIVADLGVAIDVIRITAADGREKRSERIAGSHLDRAIAFQRL